MIRWYDYIAAIITAEFITAFLFAGIYSGNIFYALLFGFIAGMIYNLWDVVYCNIRLKKEIDLAE